MGLDSVELVMAFEEAFGIAIPDEIAASLSTPRLVIDYVHSQLPNIASGACLAQRAFYRIRGGLQSVSAKPRSAIRPSTRFDDVFADDPAMSWGRLRIELAAAKWPRYRPARPAGSTSWTDVSTVGELSEFLVFSAPRTLLARGEGWSRAQVAEVVHHVIREEIGITDYSEDSRFVQDMGID